VTLHAYKVGFIIPVVTYRVSNRGIGYVAGDSEAWGSSAGLTRRSGHGSKGRGGDKAVNLEGSLEMRDDLTCKQGEKSRQTIVRRREMRLRLSLVWRSKI